MIVVVGESGEYADRFEMVLGVFDTLEAAETAVEDAKERYKVELPVWNAWHDRRRDGVEEPEPKLSNISWDVISFYEVSTGTIARPALIKEVPQE